MVAAQSAADAARLEALGAENVTVMGNLKFDIKPPEKMLDLGRQLRARLGERKIFLAASTRAGEEEIVLAALEQINIPDLLTVIVPRHPQRFEEVAALLTRQGIDFQRRSTDDTLAPATKIVLGDSMGEMFAYYAACDLAFIGGSLLPFGGQNLLEACATGKPVLIGPHTYNFTQASQFAVASNAAKRVRNSAELALAVQNLLTDSSQLAQMGSAGLRFVNAHRGATDKAMLHVQQFIH